MNNLQNVVEIKVQKTTLNFGVSTLHAQIRFFECPLHKSYRLQIKKWQVCGTVFNFVPLVKGNRPLCVCVENLKNFSEFVDKEYQKILGYSKT
ncbi:hypothetical protein PR048_017331 [Dryococelus australis]|uniref:Uncharacterized protein n=1 Tax=Dryococelus australis TaxID=614101 RepID=A0ABQ9H9A0_9NEOP|nr:hypothetical protein PR048_017331 [Dryococelus australis]